MRYDNGVVWLVNPAEMAARERLRVRDRVQEVVRALATAYAPIVEWIAR